MSENIQNMEKSHYYSYDLPPEITCMGWRIHLGCTRRVNDKRHNKFCINERCWTGCTETATICIVMNYNERWEVCKYCANRQTCALDDRLSCLGNMYDMKTNKKILRQDFKK